MIESSDGGLVYEEDQIASVIAAYFSDIFTSSANDCDDIKTALVSIHPDKAPGLDGFSASFFQSNWDTTGPALIQEIQALFRHGSLPTSINSTHIRLIPKIPCPKTVADYRPITLCNVFYKVISKLLSLRL